MKITTITAKPKHLVYFTDNVINNNVLFNFCHLPCLQVYVEFDDQEWEKREWVKVYEDFQLFLLEHQLVWAKRKEGGAAGGGAGGLLQGSKAKHIQWPALVRPGFSIYKLGTTMGPVSQAGCAVTLQSCRVDLCGFALMCVFWWRFSVIFDDV